MTRSSSTCACPTWTAWRSDACCDALRPPHSWCSSAPMTTPPSTHSSCTRWTTCSNRSGDAGWRRRWDASPPRSRHRRPGPSTRSAAEDGRYLLRATLAEIERRWEPFGFVRVHRQYVANLLRAVELRPLLGGTAELGFPGGQTIPVARRHAAELGRRLGVGGRRASQRASGGR